MGDKDVKYKMAQQITKTLYQSILDSTLSSPDWHSICLSHLARQIAFNESSSPRMGIFCAQYIDLTRKFLKIFTEHKEDEQIKQCMDALNTYWRLLYCYGLKDNRILELQQRADANLISLVLRILYRGIATLIVCAAAMPGFLLGLPLPISFRLIRRAKVKAGLVRNYDEIAQTKMVVTCIWVPLLTIVYSLIVSKRWGGFYGKMFGVAFPFLLWFTMRASQDGAAYARSVRTLLKLLFLSKESRKKL